MPWSELLANLAIVAVASSTWTAIFSIASRYPTWCQRLALGSLMGLATLLAMLLPFEFVPGVFVDLRYSLVAIAGLFGGPLAAAIPAFVAILRRLALGGTGIWVAIPNIALAFAAGSAGFRFLRSGVPSVRAIALLSAAVVVSGTLGFFVKMPTTQWWPMTIHMIAPFGLVLFASTFLSGIAISQEIRRQAALKENWIYRSVIDALPDSLHAKDQNGRFLAVNPAAAKMISGADVASAIGRTATDFRTPETAAAIARKEFGVMSGKATERFEEEIERANGERFWLSTLRALSAMPTDASLA